MKTDGLTDEKIGMDEEALNNLNMKFQGSVQNRDFEV